MMPGDMIGVAWMRHHRLAVNGLEKRPPPEPLRFTQVHVPADAFGSLLEEFPNII